jgi:hypothetical protein
MHGTGIHILLIYLSQPFKLFGIPKRYKRAKGAPILAKRSTKSQIGSPAIGRIRAVANPQKAIQSTAILMGFMSIKRARAISKAPISGRIVTAVSAEIPTEVK